MYLAGRGGPAAWREHLPGPRSKHCSDECGPGGYRRGNPKRSARSRLCCAASQVDRGLHLLHTSYGALLNIPKDEHHHIYKRQSKALAKKNDLLAKLDQFRHVEKELQTHKEELEELLQVPLPPPLSLPEGFSPSNCNRPIPTRRKEFVTKFPSLRRRRRRLWTKSLRRSMMTSQSP